MAKAPDEIINVLNNNEDIQQFTVVPAGEYLCVLDRCTEYEPAEGKEFGGMRTFWKILQPREFKGEKLMNSLSWSPKAAWKIREFWDALGYEYDSDFDEPVEQQEQAILVVSVGQVNQGKRKGQEQNNVDEVLEATPEAVAEVPA